MLRKQRRKTYKHTERRNVTSQKIDLNTKEINLFKKWFKFFHSTKIHKEKRCLTCLQDY